MSVLEQWYLIKFPFEDEQWAELMQVVANSILLSI